MNKNMITIRRLALFCLPMLLVGEGGFAENVAHEAYAFGVIADCQYCNVASGGRRKYAMSDKKLAHCVADFNGMDLAFVIHLGDFIDRDFDSFAVVNPIYAQLKMPSYHALGNHDFSVSDDRKGDVPATMGLTSRYYDFEVKGWRHVVLDGNDVSLHAYPRGSDAYKAAQAYYDAHHKGAPTWNGALGEEQLAWLRSVLEKATARKENVILYCHFPVFPKNIHNLWNDEAVVALLSEFPCVKAYMNGHNHKGNYGTRDGVHYITFKGMVDTEQTSYAVIRAQPDFIEFTGYGRETNRVMNLR